MDIIMIRHGESTDNVEKILSTYDTQLTEKGILQIKRATELIRPYKVNKIYYSPLTRTDQTRKYLELEGIPEERIREINFGIFAGYKYEEFIVIYPEESKLWIDNPYEYDIPDGESLNTVYKRVVSFLDEIVSEDEDVILVTHEGIIRLICCWVFENPQYFFKFKADNGSLSIVSINEGYKYIKKLNTIVE